MTRKEKDGGKLKRVKLDPLGFYVRDKGVCAYCGKNGEEMIDMVNWSGDEKGNGVCGFFGNPLVGLLWGKAKNSAKKRFWFSCKNCFDEAKLRENSGFSFNEFRRLWNANSVMEGKLKEFEKDELARDL